MSQTSELVELVELVESSLESSCGSCTARLRRLGPVLWQAPLLQLELVEEMLPKKVEVRLKTMEKLVETCFALTKYMIHCDSTKYNKIYNKNHEKSLPIFQSRMDLGDFPVGCGILWDSHSVPILHQKWVEKRRHPLDGLLGLPHSLYPSGMAENANFRMKSDVLGICLKAEGVHSMI